MKKYICNMYPQADFETFYMESVSTKEDATEANKIRDFRNTYYPYNVLLKSENGVNFFKSTISSSLMTLVDLEFDASLLADFDSNGVAGWVSDINDMSRENYTNRTKLVVENCCYSSGDISGYDIGIEVGGEIRAYISLVGFDVSMEITAGIDKGQHGGDEKDQLTSELAEREKFVQALQTTFF